MSIKQMNSLKCPERFLTRVQQAVKVGSTQYFLLSLVRADPGIPNYRFPDYTLNKFEQTK